MNRTESWHGIKQRHRVEAVIDGIHRNVLRGWAWFPAIPERAALLEVEIDGRPPFRVEADMLRQDLVAAGKREGRCAFEVPLSGPEGSPIQVSIWDELGKVRQRLDKGDLRTGSPTPESALSCFPQSFSTASGLRGFIDEVGPTHLRGWAIPRDNSAPHVNLAIFEGSRQILAYSANRWRDDLAELRDGRGCCGFEVLLPQYLRDNRLHILDVRIAGTSISVLHKPLWIQMQTSDSCFGQPAPLARPADPASSVTLSIIVNFYNMPREAARTLQSLTRNYQEDSNDLNYEVLCIDNGSHPPLDQNWVESFGPEFRLFRPSKQLSSPCSAINQAALQARGRYLGIMIDGAHVLTPGVFKEALLAWKEDPHATVAVRHWFIGGDQRWLSKVGYTREQEDLLFQRISWPANGYEMFRIGAPIGESPEPWFDGLTESNCLLLPTSLFDQLGGIDESFDEAGGGFANLDLWRRAADCAQGQLIALIGEATFHQYHGGTTTNVDDEEKDIRVRAYSDKYQKLRGMNFAGVHRDRLRYRGRLSADHTTGFRQRPLMPIALPITDRIRPGQLAVHFEPAAQDYLQSVYAECRLHLTTRWRGRATGIAPGDLINLQEILDRLRPDCVVLVSAQSGLISFVDDVTAMLGLSHIRMICAHRHSPQDLPISPRILPLHGDLVGLSTHAVSHALLACETVLVLLATDTDPVQVPAILDAYAKMVSNRSWLVCLDVLLGQPWLGYSTHNTRKAILDFVATQPDFVIDHSWNQHLISTSPDGYLHKIGNTSGVPYDPTIDNLSTVDYAEA